MTNALLITTYPTLYNLDTKGKVRIWRMERDGNNFRTISGLEDGKQAASGWSVATPKNIGKINETTNEEQAHSEILNEYKKKMDRKYYENRDDVLNLKAGGHKYFAPMLAQTYESWDKIRTKNKWAYSQPKLDGVRADVKHDGIFSRSGKPFPAVRHIYDILRSQATIDETLVFDGELYNHALRDNFDEIVSLVKKQKPTDAELDQIMQNIEYHIYDVVDISNPLQFIDRYATLCDFSVNVINHPKIKFVRTDRVYNAAELDKTYQEYLTAGYEGQMIRTADGEYENKRTFSLLKRKEFLDDEFPILRIEAGDGNWAGLAKRIVLALPDGREFGSGLRGDQTFAYNLLHQDPPPRYATIRFQNYTPDGVPRFPVAVRFHNEQRDI